MKNSSKTVLSSRSPCITLMRCLLTVLIMLQIVINPTTSTENSNELTQFFNFQNVMYYISNSTTDVQQAKEICEKEGYSLLSIETEIENENLKEHLQKIEREDIDGVWTSGTKISRNSTTEYIWSTTELSFTFSDFDKLNRIGLKRSARNRRDLVVIKDCNCSNSSCNGGSPSLSCNDAPKCNITLGPCKTTTYPCDVECPTCNAFRPNCSSTCPPCVVESPVCEAIQGPCTVISGECTTTTPKCTITTPDCITIRPDCVTIQEPCKPALPAPPCQTVPRCRINTGELCTTSQPPCVTTQPPCVTTQSPCYEVTTPALCNQKCVTRYVPFGCSRKRDTNCKAVKTCEPICPDTGNSTTLVCPQSTTTCQPPTTTCPPAKTTCKPAIDCTPIVCQSPPIVCQDPSTHCPPAHTICPPPVIKCDDPVTSCPDADVFCPEPEIRCSKPFVRCPGPEVSCPGVITSCSEATVICPPPKVECPEPHIKCEKPTLCDGHTFGPTIPNKTCEECTCPPEATTPMPDPDAEEVFISGCVGLQRKYGYKWDVQECKAKQHFICEW